MDFEGFVTTILGGFYTVRTEHGVFICRARGRFRKEGISPCAGDWVIIETENGKTGALTKIKPRKNHFTRPPVANVDRLFIVASLLEPTVNTLLIDKALAVAELNGVQPVVVFTKTDLGDVEPLRKIYSLAGIPCCGVSSQTGMGIEKIRELVRAQVSAFIGNSGVGKSTLLNMAFPGLDLQTGEISHKLGRGRHTTRQVEFFPLPEGGWIADTPGFSTFDMERYCLTDKSRLVEGFREMNAFAQKCQFTSCSHTCEKGCAVLQALHEEKIARSRFESYLSMYQEIKGVKKWEQKRKHV